MTKKYLVTWDMLQIHGRELASRLLPADRWKGLIAVSRGGLVPAALIARELNIRHNDTLCIASYQNHYNQGEVSIIKKPEVTDGGAGYLIVDDLVDTGNTAQVIRELYPQAYFVTIFAKPAGKPFVNDYVIDIPQDTWIEQPWDTGVQFVEPLVKKGI